MLPIIATPVVWLLVSPMAGILMLVTVIITIMRNKIDLQKTFAGQYKRTFPLKKLFGKKN